MMKNKALLIVLLLMLSAPVWAQREPGRYQEAMARIKAERVTFLTEKLQLTTDESEKFWPIYNEYLSKREGMMWGRRERMPRNFNPDEMSDEESQKMLNDILDQEVKLAELKKEYFEKLTTVIPVKKVLTLHRVEQEFMNHMLNQIRQDRTPGGGKREGPDPGRQ
jgi:hypothetical protein